MTDTPASPHGSERGVLEMGQRALAAWEHGEHSGDYADFRALLGEVRLFSHPYLGRHDGPTAADQLEELMAGRERKPNRLNFTNIVVTAGEGTAVCLFDSSGLIGGETDYSGYNAIAFLVEGDRITGFREYFGTS